MFPHPYFGSPYFGDTYFPPLDITSVTISSSDSFTISVTETSSNLVMLDRSDTDTISITESTSIFADGTHTDTDTVMVVDTSSLLVILSSSDAFTISITESSMIVASGQTDFSASDSFTISVSEMSSNLVELSRSDTDTISETETSQFDKNFDQSDTFTLPLTATTMVTKSSSDSVGVAVVESVGVVVFLFFSAETITIPVGNTGSLLHQLSRSDTVTISVASTKTLRVFLSRSESLNLVLTDTGNIFETHIGSDIVHFDLPAASFIYKLTLKSSSDSISMTTDTSSLLVFLSRVDGMLLHLSESSNIVYGFVNHNDSFTLNIGEAKTLTFPGDEIVFPPVLLSDDFFPDILASIVAILLPVENAEDMAGRCEFLWYIHPELYKEPRLLEGNAQRTVDRYRGLLRSIDGQFCTFRDFITEMITFLDPTEAPYDLLQLLAPLLGIDFNFDIPEEFARRELVNAIFLWQRKGTRDNVSDWIRFLTGFSVTIREFYKEVLRRNVFGQAYPENTLPHLNEHHNRNIWAQGLMIDPWTIIPNIDTNYGRHGFSDKANGQGRYPGFLFRNHVGLYLGIEDFNLEESWFGTSFFTVLIQKIEKIIDMIALFGVVHHIFYNIITEEFAPYIIFGSPTIVGYDLDEEDSEQQADLLNSYIEAPCTGRFVNVWMCRNDTAKVTNTPDHWFRYEQETHYWEEWIGDSLLTYVGPTLISTLPIPPEDSAFELYVDANIGFLGNQGFDAS